MTYYKVKGRIHDTIYKFNRIVKFVTIVKRQKQIIKQWELEKKNGNITLFNKKDIDNMIFSSKKEFDEN